MGHPNLILSVVGAKYRGLSWAGRTPLRIGTMKGLEVCLDEPSLHSLHACVLPVEDGWAVCDLGSKTGTILEHTAVAGKALRLQSRDMIRCGEVVFAVTLTTKEIATAIDTPRGTFHIRATASGGEQLESLASSERLPVQSHHFARLRIDQHFRSTTSANGLIQVVLDETRSALEARRAGIFLLDVGGGPAQSGFLSPDPQEGRPFDSRLIQRCLASGESLLCEDISGGFGPRQRHERGASLILVLLRAQGRNLGVMGLEREKGGRVFSINDFLFAEAVATSLAASLDANQTAERERELLEGSVAILVRAVELRDRYTGSHTLRVTDYAAMLAEAQGVSRAEAAEVRTGTLLHDIGKIGIPDEILNKPGRLSESEYALMQQHTVLGANLLDGLAALQPLVPMIRSHHERWDGEGYPDRLTGSQIPRLARIVAVADAFDAMTSDRPYRKALSLAHAFAEIEDGAGKHFDPACVEAFLSLRSRIEARVREPVSESPAQPLGRVLGGPHTMRNIVSSPRK